jgi:hypothetical protein
VETRRWFLIAFRDPLAVCGQVDKLGWINFTLHHLDIRGSVTPPFVFCALERGEWSVSLSAWTPGKEPLGTYSIGGWYGLEPIWILRSGRKFLAPAANLTPTVQPVAGRYTDSRISALLMHTLYILKQNVKPQSWYILFISLIYFTPEDGHLMTELLLGCVSDKQRAKLSLCIIN